MRGYAQQGNVEYLATPQGLYVRRAGLSAAENLLDKSAGGGGVVV